PWPGCASGRTRRQWRPWRWTRPVLDDVQVPKSADPHLRHVDEAPRPTFGIRSDLTGFPFRLRVQANPDLALEFANAGGSKAATIRAQRFRLRQGGAPASSLHPPSFPPP